MADRIIFVKEGEKFAKGEHLVIPCSPVPLHGKVADNANGLLLVVALEDGPPPASARRISRNLTVYGFSQDRTKLALW